MTFNRLIYKSNRSVWKLFVLLLLNGSCCLRSYDLFVSVWLGFMAYQLLLVIKRQILLPSWLGPKNTPTISLQRGKNPPTHTRRVYGYDTKQSDCEVPIMLEHWRMRSTSSLSLLIGPLWPGVVASDRVLGMSQTKLNCVIMPNWIDWNRNVLIFKLCTYVKLNCLKLNFICIKMDLILNNLQ